MTAKIFQGKSKDTMNVSRETSQNFFHIVALDGPSGVGKSSCGREAAQALNFCFLSSGQVYRAITWWALEQGWEPERPVPESLLADLHVTISANGHLSVNGKIPGEALSSEEISQATSKLSGHADVRTQTNRILRETVETLASTSQFGGVILEGRDIGTVVYPEAGTKFFLTANAKVRAERRFNERARQEPGLTLEAVMTAMADRDNRDSSRELAPLTQADDAHVIDSSDLTMAQVVAQMVAGVGESRPEVR